MSSLPQNTDYLIVGGGTAGLVVACRLSENPNVKVMVLESGPNCTQDPRVQNPDGWHNLSGSELDWKLKIIPQAVLNFREQNHPAGKVLGGSSAINGLAYVPPSPADIDAWEKLGNPGWNWESLRPYLQKSYTVTAPGREHLDNSHKPTNGPIQVSYPALANKANHPLLRAWEDAFTARGYEPTRDILAEGQTTGTRPYAATIDPATGYRSSADSTYGTAASWRSNVTIITVATVQRVLFNTSQQNVTATGVEVIHCGRTVTITADREVILAAGAFHTPKILELSGIGAQERLSNLGVPLLVDLPGVGENLQNHLMSVLPVPLRPTPLLEDITPGLKALAFVTLEPVERKIVFPTASLFLAVRSSNLALLGAIPCYPNSRGSTHLSAMEAMPTIDAGFLTNDRDMDILALHVQMMHEIASAQALKPFFDFKHTSTDLEKIKESLRATAITAHHTCGTAAMLPKADGGVVDPYLRVYGTRNLRIVDASVFPLIPHANPIATVYAVAERAADLIRTA